VSEVRDLQAITSLIHDEYFDVDQVTHDPIAHEVRVSIYRGTHKKRWIFSTSSAPKEPLPEPLGVLVIGGVEAMMIEDKAQIGWVDISRITYDAENGEVRLTSNIPVDVRMQVQALDVELVRT